MQIAVIADALSGFKTAKDSTFAILRAAAKVGHQIYHVGSQNVRWQAGQAWVDGHWLTLSPAALASKSGTDLGKTWFTACAQSLPLAAFDAVLMRQDPPFDSAYLHTSHLLSLAEAQGVLVLNSARALRDYNEKLAILAYPDYLSPTMVSADMSALRAFVQAQEATILKPLDGMGGAGIFRVSPHEANLSVILETLTQHGTRMLMAQRYIPAIDAGDKRILLIDGEAVPYALARIPAQGETRGNLAAGGRGVAMPLTAREREIVAAVAPKCVADGLFLVGLDVIGGYLTEINVTSPTCFQEISQQTDFDVAGYFVAMLEKRCAAL